MSLYKTLGPITFLFQSKTAQIFTTRTDYLIQIKNPILLSSSHTYNQSSVYNISYIQSLINRYNKYYNQQILSLYTQPNKPPSILINNQIGSFFIENNEYYLKNNKNQNCSKDNQNLIDICQIIITTIQLIGIQNIYNSFQVQKCMFFRFVGAGLENCKGFYLYLPNYQQQNKKQVQKQICLQINKYLDINFSSNTNFSNKLLISKLRKCQYLVQMKQQIQYFSKIYQTGAQKSIKKCNQHVIKYNKSNSNKYKNSHRTYRKRSNQIYIQKHISPTFHYDLQKRQSSSQHQSKNNKKSINLYQLHKTYQSISTHSIRNKSYATKIPLFSNRNKNSKALHSSSNTFRMGFDNTSANYGQNISSTILRNNSSMPNIKVGNIQVTPNNSKTQKRKQIQKKHINNFMNNNITTTFTNQNNPNCTKPQKHLKQPQPQIIPIQSPVSSPKNQNTQLNTKLKINQNNCNISQQIKKNLDKLKDKRIKHNNYTSQKTKQQQRQNKINVINKLDSKQIQQINQNILFNVQNKKQNQQSNKQSNVINQNIAYKNDNKNNNITQQIQKKQSINNQMHIDMQSKIKQMHKSRQDMSNNIRFIQNQQQISQYHVSNDKINRKEPFIVQKKIKKNNVMDQQLTIRVNGNQNYKNERNSNNNSNNLSTNMQINNTYDKITTISPNHQSNLTKKKPQIQQIHGICNRNSIRDSQGTSIDGAQTDKNKYIHAQKQKTTRKKGNISQLLQKNIIKKLKAKLQRINYIGQTVTKTPNFMTVLDQNQKFFWQLPAFILYKQFYLQRINLQEYAKQQSLTVKSEKNNLLAFLSELHEQNIQAIDSLTKLLRTTLKKLKKYNIDSQTLQQSKNQLNMDLTLKWSSRMDQIIYTYITQIDQLRQQCKKQIKTQGNKSRQKQINIIAYQIQVMDALLIVKGCQMDLQEKKKIDGEKDKQKILGYMKKRWFDMMKLLKK